jgi:hypothetical protein
LKKSKQYLLRAVELATSNDENLNDALLDLICYSPKFPARFQQQSLLNDAENFSVSVADEHFSKTDLKVNGFRWGNGKKKIWLTHGWGSKAADFFELINTLRQKDVSVISFDAPGNGSSEGELSNLILYTKAITAVVAEWGVPDILIGHSLGAMANINFIKETQIAIPTLVSITPLIKLKEHFELIMNTATASATAQTDFFENFKKLFNIDVGYFDFKSLYHGELVHQHHLFYDLDDKLSPAKFIESFLTANPEVKSTGFTGVGHEKMMRDAEVIRLIDGLV